MSVLDRLEGVSLVPIRFLIFLPMKAMWSLEPPALLAVSGRSVSLGLDSKDPFRTLSRVPTFDRLPSSLGGLKNFSPLIF